MFYCEPCQIKNKWPASFHLSTGRCECCGKITDCYDVASYNLPKPKDNSVTECDSLFWQWANEENTNDDKPFDDDSTAVAEAAWKAAWNIRNKPLSAMTHKTFEQWWKEIGRKCDPLTSENSLRLVTAMAWQASYEAHKREMITILSDALSRIDYANDGLRRRREIELKTSDLVEMLAYLRYDPPEKIPLGM